mgnify:CR=1 FL=1
MAGCEDFDEIRHGEILAWGEAPLAFPRRHEKFYFGVPKADWPRTPMNRIDPALFAARFHAEVAAYFAGLQTTGLDTLETMLPGHPR